MPWSFLVWQTSSFLSELIGLFQWMAARMRCTEILKLIRNIEQNWETITLLVLPFPDIWHLSGTWCNFFSFFFKKTLIKLLPENSSHLGWDKTSYPLRSWCYHFFLHGQGKCIFLDACRALHYHWMFWMKQRAKLSCPLPKKNLDRALTLSCPETECHIIQYVEVLKRKLFKL